MQGITEVLIKKFGKNLGVRVIKRIREDDNSAHYLESLKDKTPSAILARSFFWIETPEGGNYWSDIYLSLGGEWKV